MNDDDQEPGWHPGEIIDGRYEVIRLAGEGGMGRVYQVKHLQWGIDLAVKQPSPEALRNPGARERFVEEAEAWVSLGLYPNLCCCHYVRQFDGLPMAFAEYVPGGSLRSWITAGRLYEGTADDVLRRILDVAVQFAWGLGHAHRRGLVHQDVKPDNVLLDTTDGDISVKVTDFGLARARAGTRLTPLDTNTDAGEAASILVSRAGLTKQYASPEQMVGAVLSRRTDVYSYAVSVLEMFTGKRLWQTGSRAGQALSTYISEGASKSGTPAIPASFAALLAACLHRDPAQRPGSMVDIAAEISSIYQSAAHAAYPRTMPSAASLRADELNNRAVSLLDLERTAEAEEAFTAARQADPQHLTATYNAGLLQWRRGRITDDDLLRQVQAAHDPAGDLVPAQCLYAYVHLERGDIESARTVLDVINQDTLSGPEVLAAQHALASGRYGDTSIHHTASRWDHHKDRLVRREPEAAWKALPSGRHIDESLDRTTSVKKRRRDPLLDLLEEPARFSREGAHAVTGDAGGNFLRQWDVKTGDCLSACGTGYGNDPFEHVDISADGRFGVGSCGNRVEVWDFTSGLRTHEFFVNWFNNRNSESSRVSELRISPDGQRVFAGTGGEIFGWDLHAGEPSLWQRFDGFDTGISFEVGADGSHLLVRSGDDLVGHRASRHDQLVYLTQRKRLVLAELDAQTPAMALTADGRIAVTASEDRLIRVWDLHSGECVKQIPSTARISTLAVSEDARWTLSGGGDNVRLWDLATGRCLRTFDKPILTRAVWLSPDARTGRTANITDIFQSWSFRHPFGYEAPPQLSRPRQALELTQLSRKAHGLIREAQQAIADRRYAAAHRALTHIRTLPGHERDPEMLRTSRELGQYLARTGLRGAWTTPSSLTVDFSNTVRSASIAADASVVITGHERNAYLWNVKNGDLLYTYPVDGVRAVGLSTDRQQVVCATIMGEIHAWSTQTGAELFSLKLPRDKLPVLTQDEVRKPIESDSSLGDGPAVVLMSSNGKRLLWRHGNGLELWDTDTKRHLHTLPGHPRRAEEGWLSADGRTAVYPTKKSIRLWDLDDGECLLAIPIPGDASPEPISVVCASPDRKQVVAWGSALDHKMRMWNSAGEPVRDFECPDGVRVTQFSPDGRFIFAGDNTTTIKVWDSTDGTLVQTLNGNQGFVRDIQFTPGGRFVLVSGAHSSSVQIWELDWELDPSGNQG